MTIRHVLIWKWRRQRCLHNWWVRSTVLFSLMIRHFSFCFRSHNSSSLSLAENYCRFFAHEISMLVLILTHNSHLWVKNVRIIPCGWKIFALDIFTHFFLLSNENKMITWKSKSLRKKSHCYEILKEILWVRNVSNFGIFCRGMNKLEICAKLFMRIENTNFNIKFFSDFSWKFKTQFSHFVKFFRIFSSNASKIEIQEPN